MHCVIKLDKSVAVNRERTIQMNLPVQTKCSIRMRACTMRVTNNVQKMLRQSILLFALRQSMHAFES